MATPGTARTQMLQNIQPKTCTGTTVVLGALPSKARPDQQATQKNHSIVSSGHVRASRVISPGEGAGVAGGGSHASS